MPTRTEIPAPNGAELLSVIADLERFTKEHRDSAEITGSNNPHTTIPISIMSGWLALLKRYATSQEYADSGE